LLDETTNDFGDVDLQVGLSNRAAEHDAAGAAVAYARASGRTFANFPEERFWAKTEGTRLRKNRNGYLSIHTEDLRDVTDRMRVLSVRPNNLIRRRAERHVGCRPQPEPGPSVVTSAGANDRPECLASETGPTSEQAADGPRKRVANPRPRATARSTGHASAR
jgi:hypothetical protein